MMVNYNYAMAFQFNYSTVYLNHSKSMISSQLFKLNEVIVAEDTKTLMLINYAYLNK